MTTSDPRETEHIECNCVPELGPSHCHLCSERAGHPVPWSEAHPDGVPDEHDDNPTREHGISLSDLCKYASHRANDEDPGDHDELLAAAVKRIHALAQADIETESELLLARFVVALRAGQSARQTSDAERRRWFNRHAALIAERDALRQRLTIAEAIISRSVYRVREEYPRDQVLAVLQNPLPSLAVLTAPTESKEPDHE